MFSVVIFNCRQHLWQIVAGCKGSTRAHQTISLIDGHIKFLHGILLMGIGFLENLGNTAAEQALSNGPIFLSLCYVSYFLNKISFLIIDWMEFCIDVSMMSRCH